MCFRFVISSFRTFVIRICLPLGGPGPERAKELLESVVKSYKQQPRHAQSLNRDWYDVARRNLEG